jgi:hypothetical protein
MKRLAGVAVGLALLGLGAGCGSSDGGGPALVPATGKVTFKNEGLTAASIVFTPDAEKGNRGQMATAVLQQDGSFTMETYPKGAGVVPGAYKVSVITRRPDAELEKYKDAKTTPLSVDVPEGGLKDKLFELK